MPEVMFANFNATTPCIETPAATHRSIGSILVHDKILTAEDVLHVVAHQKAEGLSFGQAAVHLRLITPDVLARVLARQFDYPCLQPGNEISAEVVTAYDPFCAIAEQMRSLRAQLLTARAHAGTRRITLAIASAGQGEGRSFIAANLAVVFSQMGERTLLIDANLRAPRLHQLFQLDASKGLSTLLMGRSDESVICKVAALSNLSVLAAGPIPPNPQELLCKPRFQKLLDDAAAQYDVVIIDTPAFELAADAQLIATRVDSLLLVAHPGSTHLPAFKRLCATLTTPLRDASAIVINQHQAGPRSPAQTWLARLWKRAPTVYARHAR